MYCGDQLCLDSISYLSIKSNSVIHFHGNTNSSGTCPPCQVRSPRSLHTPSGGAGTNRSLLAEPQRPNAGSAERHVAAPRFSGAAHLRRRARSAPLSRRAPTAPARGGDSGTRQLAANAAPRGIPRAAARQDGVGTAAPRGPVGARLRTGATAGPLRARAISQKAGPVPGHGSDVPPAPHTPPAARSEAAAPTGPDSAKLQERRIERRAEPWTPPRPYPTVTPVTSRSLQVSPVAPGGCEAVPGTGSGRDAARQR